MKAFPALYLFLLILGVIFSDIVSGQSHTIRVLDQKTGEAIPYAHVCFEDMEGDDKQFLLSNEKGDVNYNFKARSLIAISCIGYETYIDTLKSPGDKEVFLIPTVFNINEVVVTAQYTPERVDQSIYKVNLITAKQVEEKAATNLNDLLGSELNFRVSQDGALGSSLSLQGLSGEHIKFLVDGVPVIGRMNGNIDISQLNLYNVDHVEIIEGPMSVVYGSNALAGVINIITKESLRGSVRVNGGAYYESVGVYNFDAMASFRKKKNNFSVSASRNFFDGYTTDKSTRSMQWDPKRQWNFDTYYLYDIETFKMKLSASYFNEKLENKGDLQPRYYETALDNYFYTDRVTAKMDLVKSFMSKRFLNLVGAYSWYQREKETYLKDLTTLNQNLTPNTEDHDTTRFDNILIRGTYSKSDKSSVLNYQMGLDFNIERGWGKRITDYRQEIGDYAAFISLKYAPIPSFTVQPGLRLIYNTKYDAPLVYSLNLRWQPLESLSTRVSYSRGFRAPSLKELYLYFFDVNHKIKGNENLKSEDSHNFNASLSYFRELDVHYFGFEIKGFYNNINNIITLAYLGQQIYTYANVDKYITKGLELEAKYKFYPNLEVKLGVVETGRYNNIEPESDDTKSFNYSTDFIANVSYKVIKWNANIAMFYKYSGEVPYFYVDEDGELLEGYISDFNTMDITLQKFFYGNKLVLGAGVKNIFDVVDVLRSGTAAGGVHSGNSSYSVGWGRTFFVKLTFNLIKN